MKIYVVFFSDVDNELTIEKIYKNETDAKLYCETFNKNLAFNLYHYEEYDVE